MSAILRLALVWRWLVIAAGAALSHGASAQVSPSEQSYLALAKDGWGYELRTTMLGRNMAIPVVINGRIFAGAALCIVGEKPNPETAAVLTAFQRLITDVYGKPMLMRYAGESSRFCGSRRTVILRLYSGAPPNQALSDDLNRMNSRYQLGLPPERYYAASSPAMAQTFFGRRGQATHIMVAQSRGRLSDLEARYFKSILIEELYQAFSFGMDVLIFRRDAQFLSKLQELPVNVHRLPWRSSAFMRALLRSNPNRLCPFDVFMLHAVAQSPFEQTNDPRFLDYIATHFQELEQSAADTLATPGLDVILDPQCGAFSED